jgi:CRP-like cAMP-binding protein
MSRAAHVHEIWAASEIERLRDILQRLEEDNRQCNLLTIESRWKHWLYFVKETKRLEQEEQQRMKVIEILRQPNRCHRSAMERETIRRFLTTNLTCLPRSLTSSELDKISNEIDWTPLIGRSVLFLQGDFGNVYYMIGKGSVGLYLEPSKDREMTIAREFGHLRGQPFKGTDDDLLRLGNNIFNLPVSPAHRCDLRVDTDPSLLSLSFSLSLSHTHTHNLYQKGAGFGEYAILASTNKIRSCAAVALDEDSMLFIMHAETYNEVLRHHHYRQKQLSSATSLLQELPLFKTHNYSKIASLAYTMKSQTYSSGVTLARSGEVINNVLVIASGQVKVFATPKDMQSSLLPRDSHHHHIINGNLNSNNNHKDEELSALSESQKLIQKRIPKLAVALLGRGTIIGESEVAQGIRNFHMTYETSAAATEILEMPATVFKESINESEFKQSTLFKALEGLNEEKEHTRAGRLTRAYDVMKRMMEGDSKQIKKKEQLLSILPTVIDPLSGAGGTNNKNMNSLSVGFGNSNTARARRDQLAASGAYSLEDAEKVQRRSSTAVPFSGHTVGVTGSGGVVLQGKKKNHQEIAGLLASSATVRAAATSTAVHDSVSMHSITTSSSRSFAQQHPPPLQQQQSPKKPGPSAASPRSLKLMDGSSFRVK